MCVLQNIGHCDALSSIQGLIFYKFECCERDTSSIVGIWTYPLFQLLMKEYAVFCYHIRKLSLRCKLLRKFFVQIHSSHSIFFSLRSSWFSKVSLTCLSAASHRNIVRMPVLMRELWLEMWHDIHPDKKSNFVTKGGYQQTIF